MKTGLEIANEANFEPISTIARRAGIPEAYVEPQGRYRAKINLDVLEELRGRALGKYILVAAITPTPLGEGKTTTAIGLAMALNKVGKNAAVALRQSSLGPTFGIKGGGSGGGYAQVGPLEESIVHLNGDIHAVQQAHNQMAALVDNHWFHGNELNIDPERIVIRRVLDVNDRFLRHVTIGQGSERDGIPRQTGFDITVASELMAILALVTGENSTTAVKNLRTRIARMVVAFTKEGKPVTAEAVHAAGAATVLMREALKPNLMQTIENTPAFIHAGPFANIAHGNSSILADQIGLRVSDYLVTEGGFGMDMGGEKFFDIKCRASGLVPNAALLVATVRALKMHSGRFVIAAGKPLPPGLEQEDLDALRAGIGNLEKQIENVRLFGIPVVVAINKFPTDTEAEIAFVREAALAAGASAAHVSTMFADGGKGGEELAHALVAACDEPSSFRMLYPSEMPLVQKIETLATKLYGADGVDYEPEAERQLGLFEERGYGHFPICMAKTQYSLSHDPNLKGRPTGYRFKVRDARVSVGAGFVYPLAGSIMTMPGLGKKPGGMRMDIDEHGDIVGMI